MIVLKTSLINCNFTLKYIPLTPPRQISVEDEINNFEINLELSFCLWCARQVK